MSLIPKANASPIGVAYKSSDSSDGHGSYKAIANMSTNRARGNLLLGTLWTLSHIVDYQNFFEVVRINNLGEYKLRQQLDITIERDGLEYIARTVDIPIYALAKSATEAIEDLKAQIISLYNELSEDDNFSREWLNQREFLKSIIIE